MIPAWFWRAPNIGSTGQGCAAGGYAPFLSGAGRIKVQFWYTLPLPVSQTVETVEKVPFPKIFLESGTKTSKNALFSAPRIPFWRFSSLRWEIFARIFPAKGFSTVSLGLSK